ncbi:glycosyl hydrolase family 28-related protein [Chondromyces apiculatus]|nr:glycosyl hydrolase family 28-related protein [Chondromyces apiculatus]
MKRPGLMPLIVTAALLQAACGSQDDPGSTESGSSGQGAGSTGSGAGSQGGGGSGAGGPDYPPEADRGATPLYWEYEAEDATTTGTLLGPSRAFGDIAAEASGRRAVRLDADGQHVTFTTEHATSSIVVRYALPDAPAGGGIDATLGLYVNGTRTASLALTSRYAWLYGGESSHANNDPAAGGAHHFYDEAHLVFDEVPAGTTITLQKDAEDAAPYYVIDLVDFEKIDPPLDRPADALSITDHGATPDDASDDGPAINAAINAARADGKVLWIPPGTFRSTSGPLVTSGVTIRGAGMWHSRIQGSFAHFRVSGNDNRFHDFAVMGEVDARRDNIPENAFDGPAGTGSRLENVWIEHVKVGWWVGKGDHVGAPTQPLTDGLVIHRVRVRNTFADGVNFCNGTSNSVVEQSHFRNNGDDALAMWSPDFDGVPGVGNTFRFNTVQTTWNANCVGLYGGKDSTVEDNLCADVVVYPGILVATTSSFSPHPFSGTTTLRRNTLTRAGGPMYSQEHGALKLFADGKDVTGIRVEDLHIDDATFSGIHFQGPRTFSDIVFDGIQITGTGATGILINANALGGFQATDVVVTDAAEGGLQNDAPAFTIDRLDGNTGW